MKKIIITTIAAIAQPANAITVHRVTSLADHGNGTLRAAVAAAAAGDRITFAPWLYEKTIRLDSEISINKNLRIEGDINGDRRPDITLDGQHQHRLLNIAAGATVTLWAISLEHGKATQGGAIYNRGNITAQFCRINENHTTVIGGGIYNRGKITIDHTSMRDNIAPRGGAIFTGKLEESDAADTTLNASTFAWNRALEHGGVMYNYSGKFRSFRSTFSKNVAQAYGGWEHNTMPKGSVLYAYGGSNEFTDSTLKNNKSAPLRDPELKECTTAARRNRCRGCSCRPDAERKENNKNRRINNGGTLFNHGVLNNPQPIKLIRTVISESRGRNCGGWGTFTLDHTWSDDDTCDGDANFSEPGTSRGDAKLGPLMDLGGYTYTYAALPDSGLIDAAGSVCAAADQRGARRTEFMDPHCDIGAVETNAHPPTRLRPQTINTTPPAEHNEDLAVLHKRITAQQADISAKTETIRAQQADISAKTEIIRAQQADISAKTETITTLQTQLQTLNNQLAAVQERITNKDGDITQLKKQAAELERKIAEHQARIAELEAPDDLEITIGDAGEIKRLTLNGSDALHESETSVRIRNTTQQLKNTTTTHVHERPDGTKTSAGQFDGENGTIHWEIVTRTIPGTNWHVSRWTFNSNEAFGDVAVGIYADIDIQPYTRFNGLIVGGTNHDNRLLITDRPNPSEGIALGLRALKNANSMGWVGSPDIYHGYNGEVLDASILTGPYSGWGSYTPDSNKYPGAAGYGPADVAIAIGIQLKPTAKLASFESTVVGAPNGYVEN
ncbi:choice-of-anchor Q domain-containing protein [Thiolapillus sp.]|uniref:choice-of-anchor Q domain-containing protein n=1 Tax=Thiolapillus sp. TaxID=2017437 RepID=UPI0025E99060|nr:choice-of-anchor Q domain-containing protein [Thiolapillus sp.]